MTVVVASLHASTPRAITWIACNSTRCSSSRREYPVAIPKQAIVGAAACPLALGQPLNYRLARETGANRAAASLVRPIFRELGLSSFIDKICGRRFLKNLGILSGGTVIGQMLIVLSSPILTRIYTPEEFGGFAVFSSLAATGAVAIGLRYEFAIPVAESDDAAIGLVVLTTLIALAISVLAALALWAWQPVILDALQTPMLAGVLWLLPPALFIYGAGSALNFWSIRQGTFQVNGVNRVIQFGTQAFSQVALGLMALGSVGLIVGYTAGYATRLVHFVLSLPRTTRAQLFRPSPAVMRRMISTHWRYPVFSTSSSLLGTACEMLPAVLIAMLYGPAMAGWFALSQRIVALPVRMLSDSASQVFLSAAATAERSAILRLFRKTIALFLVMGIVGIVPVVFIAPSLFAFVFGEPWREAGIIVQLLAPLYLARFVVMPLSQTLNVLRRQDLSLLVAFGNGIAMLVSFAIGWWLALDPNWTIGLFGATGALTFILYIPLAWHILRSGTTLPPQPHA